MKTIIEAVARLIQMADVPPDYALTEDQEAIRTVLDAFLSKEGCESLKTEIAAFLGQGKHTPGDATPPEPMPFTERREIGRQAVDWVDKNGLPVTAMTIIHALAELRFLRRP